MSWNPVTGCLKGCEYCYARRIAVRYGGSVETCPDGKLHILDAPMYADSANSANGNGRRFRPYPYMFDPTFHRYRLGEPAKMLEPQTVFVCSMGDLLGEWVPDKWIEEVLGACAAARWHRYLFLTKNPKRYDNMYVAPLSSYLSDLDSFMLGATATNNQQLRTAYESMANWLSIEPLLEDVSGVFEACSDSADPIKQGVRKRWDWVVIGAETGDRKNKVPPDRKWIEDIVDVCKSWKTPVYMKNNLAPFWGNELIQQFPWE